MSRRIIDTDSGKGNQSALVAAWLFVGVPLLWGVWFTLQNVLKLFS